MRGSRLSRIDRFSAPSLGRALGRGGHRPSLLFSFNHPHDPRLRQVAVWIAYPPRYVRVRVLSENKGGPWASAAEIGVTVSDR